MILPTKARGGMPLGVLLSHTTANVHGPFVQVWPDSRQSDLNHMCACEPQSDGGALLSRTPRPLPIDEAIVKALRYAARLEPDALTAWRWLGICEPALPLTASKEADQ